MRQGTTPQHTFTLPFDVSMVSSVQIIYVQGNNVVLTKKTEDCTLDGSTITTTLTQAETLKFAHSTVVKIQVRVLTPANQALASEIMTTPVYQCLNNDILV